MSLTLSRGGMQMSQDDLGNSSASLTPDSYYPQPQYSIQALKYIADGWGKPVAFYRWPTGAPEVDQMVQGTGARDTQDRDGKLMDSNWWNSANPNYRTNFIATIHALPVDPTSPRIPHSSFLLPVIVSAGPDSQFGFNSPSTPGEPDPMKILDPNAASDNIYNFRLTIGGRGG
jgi:hypothetical protein